MVRPLPIDHPWVDSSAAPVYEVSFPRSATAEELRAYFQATESWSRRVNQKVIWLMDGSKVREFGAAQRAEFAAFLEKMHTFDERYTHAAVLVLTNPWLRGAATAVFWLHRPPYRSEVCASIEEGRAWALARKRELETNA